MRAQMLQISAAVHASLTLMMSAEWGLFRGPKVHLRGLGSAAPQKISRGMISSPMLATHPITHLNYSIIHSHKPLVGQHGFNHLAGTGAAWHL